MFSGGLETETEYSYKGEDEKCDFIKKDVKVYINSSLNISSDESGLFTLVESAEEIRCVLDDS